MSRMATQKEIARRAGVSVSAVSAVVNGTTHTRMSEETRARIEAVIAAVGYVPNDAARALRRQQAGTIAVVVEKVENPVYRELFHGIYEAAEARGWAVVLGDTIWMRSGSHFLARLLGRGSIDAILLRHDGLIDDEVLAHLSARSTPVVSLDGRHGIDGQWLSVDDAAAGRVATQHLIEAGHRDVAFVGGGAGVSTAQRHRGYLEAMSAAGLRPRAPVFSGYGGAAGGVGLVELLSDLPTGVVVNNVLTAVGLAGTAQARSIDVPGRLSVVGLHDAEIAELVHPQLTTVRLPLAEVGTRAVEQVSALLDGGPTDFGVVTDPPPTVISRGSVAPPSR